MQYRIPVIHPPREQPFSEYFTESTRGFFSLARENKIEIFLKKNSSGVAMATGSRPFGLREDFYAARALALIKDSQTSEIFDAKVSYASGLGVWPSSQFPGHFLMENREQDPFFCLDHRPNLIPRGENFYIRKFVIIEGKFFQLDASFFRLTNKATLKLAPWKNFKKKEGKSWSV